MNKDKKYTEKIAFLTDFIKSGGVIQTLEQIREMFGYANRAGAKGFLQRLVKDGLLEIQNRKYFPTKLLTGYPVFESVRAGLPFTPGQESAPESIEINRFLIDHPNTTFLVKVKGDSMKDAGITEGDIAIVDKSLEPKNHDIVIASIEGDVTIKYYEKKNGRVSLIPANEDYTPIILSEGAEILGVVSGIIRKYT